MAQREDHPVGIGTIAGIAIVLAALYFLQEVLLPFALALLLSFLLTPVVMWLERGRIRRIPAVALTATLALAVFAGLLWLMGTQFTALLADLTENRQQYKENLVERAKSLRGMVSGGESRKLAETLQEIPAEIAEDDGPIRPEENEEEQEEKGETKKDALSEEGQAEEEAVADDDVSDEDALTDLATEGGDKAAAERTMQDVLDRFLSGEEPVAVRVVETESTPPPQSMLRDWLGPILAPLGTAAIVVVFVIFILIQREDMRDRLIRLAGTRRVYLTTQAIDDAGARISRYLLMQLIINATYGLAVAVGLFLIGVPNALVWGLLATVFRFIPYVGPWVAASLPILLSLVVFDGWIRPLEVIGLFIVLELFSNNVMEPWLYGSSTGVSTVGIIVSATFWTWLWGPIGLVLSMPLTVCLVVLGRHVPQLGFLNVLLSDEPALDLDVRFYQRLLAFDDYEANNLVGTFLQTGTLDELYEDMLIPALSMSERDRNAGYLTDHQRRFIHRMVRGTVREMGQQFDASSAVEAVPPGAAEEAAADREPPARKALRVVCVPAEDVADRIAGMMAAQLLAARGDVAEALPIRAGAHDAGEVIARKQPHYVIISALAPGGAIPAAEGCKRLRRRLPNARVIIGLWNATGPAQKTRERLTRAGAELVTTSLAEAVRHLEEVAREADEKAAAGV